VCALKDSLRYQQSSLVRYVWHPTELCKELIHLQHPLSRLKNTHSECHLAKLQLPLLGRSGLLLLSHSLS
jgi:hypothetical protein